MGDVWWGKRHGLQYNMCELGKFNVKKAKAPLFFCTFARCYPLKFPDVFSWTTRTEKDWRRLAGNRKRETSKMNTDNKQLPIKREDYESMLQHAVAVIEHARMEIAKHVNGNVASAYWEIGKMLQERKVESGHRDGVVR